MSLRVKTFRIGRSLAWPLVSCLGILGVFLGARPTSALPSETEVAESADIPLPVEQLDVSGQSTVVASLDREAPRQSSRNDRLDGRNQRRIFSLPTSFGIRETIARVTGTKDRESFEDRPIEITNRLPVHQRSSSWLINDFVFEMEKSFLGRVEELIDEDSVMNGSRLFGGGYETLPRRQGDRIGTGFGEMTAEERVVYRSSVDALKETLSRTDVYRFLYGRVQNAELYLNWSLVHAEEDLNHVVKIYSAVESDRLKKDSTIVSKIDSRFRLANLIDAPDRLVEIRGRAFRNIQFSIFPLSSRLEVRTILLKGRGYRVGLTISEEPGDEMLLIAGLTARF